MEHLGNETNRPVCQSTRHGIFFMLYMRNRLKCCIWETSYCMTNTVKRYDTANYEKRYLCPTEHLLHIEFSLPLIWVFPKIGGNPRKWMVYNGKPYEQMDDLGEDHPYFGSNTHILLYAMLNFRDVDARNIKRVPGALSSCVSITHDGSMGRFRCIYRSMNGWFLW